VHLNVNSTPHATITATLLTPVQRYTAELSRPVKDVNFDATDIIIASIMFWFLRLQ